MFFKGTLNSSPSLSIFQNDIIGILTGTMTTEANLTSSAVNWASGSTEFINTVAPGWTLYDSAAGTVSNGVTPVVLRAPWSDDPTKYKNLYIDSYSPTSLGFLGYETWDSGTHSGTNPTSTLINSPFRAISMGVNYDVIISSSVNHIFISVAVTASSVFTYYICLSEYTRDDPWSTVLNGYPSWLLMGSGGSNSQGNGGIPRIWDSSVLNDRVSVHLSNSTPYQSVGFMPNGTMVYSTPTTAASGGIQLFGQIPIIYALNVGFGADSTMGATIYLYDMIIRQTGSAPGFISGIWLGGCLSVLNQSIYYLPSNVGNNRDIFNDGVNEYFVYQSSYIATPRLAIKKA